VTEIRLNKPVLLLIGTLLLVWLGMLLLGTGNLDRAVLNEIYGGHRPALADAARVITMFGDGRVVTLFTAIGALFLIRERQLLPAAVIVVGPMIGKALTELQKYEINRMRPAEDPHLVVVHNLSFPSGHSANAMMTYVALALFLFGRTERRSIWVAGAVALALLVGLSRVVLGVHWPSDVIGGWSYGLVWALLLYAISRRSKPGRTA
jgi:undecaprenyl-diphosphatase